MFDALLRNRSEERRNEEFCGQGRTVAYFNLIDVLLIILIIY